MRFMTRRIPAGMLFPASTYAQIKLVFSTIHERDNRSVSFKLASAETP